MLRVGELELDRAARSAQRRGSPLSLTQKEYALLEYLMRWPGLVLTRAMIAEHVWDYTFEHASNVVDVHVGNGPSPARMPGADRIPAVLFARQGSSPGRGRGEWTARSLA